MSDWSPGELLIIDLTHNDWMDLRGSLNQLLDFKLLVLCDLIEDHVFSKLAGERKSKDVRVWSEAKSSLVSLAVVNKRSSSNSYVLALSERLVLPVEGVDVPDLVGLIDDSHLTLIFVDLEQLDDLHLKVKVIELELTFVVLDCSSIFSYLIERNDILG